MAHNEGSFQLLDDAAATGAGINWPGGAGIFSVPTGVFTGGVTVQLEWSPNGGTTWLDADQGGDTFTTLTAAGAGRFELPPCLIRAAVSGGTPSAIDALAQRIDG
jgi:hypothetical protein